MKNTNNNKIAEEAGVSKSIVSQVLNNKKDVSEATREKILKVIEDLNYRPDSSAKGLATRKTKTVGLVISEITQPFFSIFVEGDDIAASYASLDRVEGYRKALQEYRIESEIIEPGYFDREDAYAAIEKILADHEEVTAIFYASDMMAVGGLKAIKTAGLSVPEDISGLGFDDIELASIIDPALSTIKQPRYRMGYLGMEKLIHKLEGKARELYV